MAGEKQLGKLVIDIEARLKKLEGDLRKAEKRTDQSAARMKASFSKVAGAIGLTFGAQQLINFAKEAVILAAKVQGVEAAFKKINAPNLLDNLRKATRNTVSDLELMQVAVRAENFKIPMYTLARGLEFAQKRASQTGQSVDYLVNSIVDGIGRKSTLILDNLGISAVDVQNEVAKIGDFGKAVGNIIERELGKMGDVALTTADRFQQINAKLENMKTSIGSELIPLANELIDVLEELGDLVNTGSGGIGKELAFYLTEVVGFIPRNYLRAATFIKKTINEIIDTDKKLATTSNELKNQRNEIEAITDAFMKKGKNSETRKTVKEIKEEIELLKKAQEDLIPGTKQYLDNVNKILQLEEKLKTTEKVRAGSISELKQKLEQAKKEHENLVIGSEAYKQKAIEINQIEREINNALDDRANKITLLVRRYEDLINAIVVVEGSAATGSRSRSRGRLPGLQDSMQLRPEINTDQYFEEITGDADEILKEKFDLLNDLTKNSAGILTSEFSEAFRRSFGEANSLGEKLFQNLIANAIEYATIMGIKLLIGSILAPATGGASMALAGAHDGGTFVNTAGKLVKAKGYASGGSFIVPPGFNNDSFPLMVESGEKVHVTPSHAVGEQEKLLAQVVSSIKTMHLAMVTDRRRMENLEVEVTGKQDGRDMFLTTKKNERIYTRTR